MTRKNYIEIARIIKDNLFRPHDTKRIKKVECDMNNLINDFVIMFKKDNDRFDKDKFIQACE